MYLASYLQNKSVVEAENFVYSEVLPQRTILPISLAEMEQHVRIDDPLEQATYIDDLIKSAINIFETYTNIPIIHQSWLTYRNNFYDVQSFELRKGKFYSLDHFQYLKDESFVDVDSDIYYVPPMAGYSQIILKPYQQWPQDADELKGAIKIQFTAGLAATAAAVNGDIKTCLYDLVAFLYANRGNNDIAGIASSGTGSESSGLNAMPNHSMMIIQKYTIKDLFGGFFI